MKRDKKKYRLIKESVKKRKGNFNWDIKKKRPCFVNENIK